jgi:hypothetical protein
MILSNRQLKKVKKANGEIIGVNVVCIFDVPCSLQEAGGMGLLTWLLRPVALRSLDSRKEAFESQEHWYLAPIRLAFGYP